MGCCLSGRNFGKILSPFIFRLSTLLSSDNLILVSTSILCREHLANVLHREEIECQLVSIIPCCESSYVGLNHSLYCIEGCNMTHYMDDCSKNGMKKHHNCISEIHIG